MKRLKPLLTLSIAALCVTGCSFISISDIRDNQSSEQSEQSNNSTSPENGDNNGQIDEEIPAWDEAGNGEGEVLTGYYDGIDTRLRGDALLGSLRTLNLKKRTKTISYGSLNENFKYTDYDINSVQYQGSTPYSNKIISFYSGNVTSSFNKEHVWPNSHGGNLVENDIHMVRPTISSENGSRGNSFYVEGKKDPKYGWDPAMESFGEEPYRGDSVRIIFYCMCVSDKLSLVESEYHESTNANRDNMMGKLSDLIKWNETYPVDAREKRRNEGAQYLQGNRNPFIDHPELACKIWGNKNSATRKLCGGKY